MTQQEIINQLSIAFAEAERIANSFSEEQFFKKPGSGKWSAAENTQHLFFSVKPLVGLFGKPELMLQFGKPTRDAMDYNQVVDLYIEKLKTFATANITNIVEGVSASKAAQIEVLHSINQKFLERAAQLTQAVLDDYQIPHPLIGMLTVREFLYFTHYHTLHHTKTMEQLLQQSPIGS